MWAGQGAGQLQSGQPVPGAGPSPVASLEWRPASSLHRPYIPWCGCCECCAEYWRVWLVCRPGCSSWGHYEGTVRRCWWWWCGLQRPSATQSGLGWAGGAMAPWVGSLQAGCWDTSSSSSAALSSPSIALSGRRHRWRHGCMLATPGPGDNGSHSEDMLTSAGHLDRYQ